MATHLAAEQGLVYIRPQSERDYDQGAADLEVLHHDEPWEVAYRFDEMAAGLRQD